jgi:hypothetical protein
MEIATGFLSGHRIYRLTGLPSGFTGQYIATTIVGGLGLANACSLLPLGLFDPVGRGFDEVSRVSASGYPVSIFEDDEASGSQVMVQWRCPFGDVIVAVQVNSMSEGFVTSLLNACQPYDSSGGIARISLDSPLHGGDIRQPSNRDEISLLTSPAFPLSLSLIDAGAFAASGEEKNEDFVAMNVVLRDGVVVRASAPCGSATMGDVRALAQLAADSLEGE